MAVAPCFAESLAQVEEHIRNHPLWLRVVSLFTALFDAEDSVHSSHLNLLLSIQPSSTTIVQGSTLQFWRQERARQLHHFLIRLVVFLWKLRQHVREQVARVEQLIQEELGHLQLELDQLGDHTKVPQGSQAQRCDQEWDKTTSCRRPRRAAVLQKRCASVVDSMTEEFQTKRRALADATMEKTAPLMTWYGEELAPFC